tara:strand:+ start:1987 stop:2394 length:408 start_codon:yes stop_codon:yes gene_type:complete
MKSRMKVASVQRLFKENYRLTLRVYKGKQFADPKMIINQLDKKTSDKIKANEKDVSIKSSMNVGDFEKEIKKVYGLTVQVADEFDRYLINDKYTLGQASRREPLIDWLKERNYKGIEDFLEKHNCKTLEEYYKKH